jgi:site-specific DNA-cytosine methylase
MIASFIAYLDLFRPAYFLIENVSGLAMTVAGVSVELTRLKLVSTVI